ncbi:hypothetical protein BH10ACI2_BH10ACI2_16370 [soil metagenome]
MAFDLFAELSSYNVFPRTRLFRHPLFFPLKVAESDCSGKHPACHRSRDRLCAGTLLSRLLTMSSRDCPGCSIPLGKENGRRKGSLEIAKWKGRRHWCLRPFSFNYTEDIYVSISRPLYTPVGRRYMRLYIYRPLSVLLPLQRLLVRLFRHRHLQSCL